MRRGHIRQLLAGHGVEYRVIAPDEMMPNIVATFDAGKPGRRLALNGHIDVFPVGDGEGWTRDPWGGELVDGRIYLRPRRCDMKSAPPHRSSPSCTCGNCATSSTAG
jgi:succinyl-diaminopimelate desuccinylase